MKKLFLLVAMAGMVFAANGQALDANYPESSQILFEGQVDAVADAQASLQNCIIAFSKGYPSWIIQSEFPVASHVRVWYDYYDVIEQRYSNTVVTMDRGSTEVSLNLSSTFFDVFPNHIENERDETYQYILR